MLFFEVTAVAFVTSGQSFIMPRGTGAKEATPSGCLTLRVVCFFGFGFCLAQQSCEGAERTVLQLSPASIVGTESSAVSAVTAALLQPKRHPPAIQTETLIVSSKRTALFEKNKLIGLAVYPCAALFVEVETRIKIVIKFQHFCNG